MSDIPESNGAMASNVKPAIQIKIDNINIFYTENKESKQTPKKLVNILQDFFKMTKTPEKVDMVEPQITVKKVVVQRTKSKTEYLSPFKPTVTSTPQIHGQKVTRLESLQNMQEPDLQPKPNSSQKIYCKIVEQDNTKPKTVILSKPGGSKTVTGIIKGNNHVWTVKMVPKHHDADPKPSTSSSTKEQTTEQFPWINVQTLQNSAPGTYQNSCLTKMSTITTTGNSSTLTQSNKTPATILECGSLKRKRSLEPDVQPKKYIKHSQQLDARRTPKVVLERIKKVQPVKPQSTHGHVKRPLTAFMLFLQSIRETLKMKYPGIKVTAIAKKAGEMWRGLKDKSEWEAKAAQNMQEYVDCRCYGSL